MLILYLAAGFVGGGVVGLAYVFADLKKIKRDNAKSSVAMPVVENNVDIFEDVDVEPYAQVEQVETQQPELQARVKQPREAKVKQPRVKEVRQAQVKQPREKVEKVAKVKAVSATVAMEVYSHSPEFYQVKATDMLNYKNIVDVQFASAYERTVVGHNCGVLNEAEVAQLNQILNGKNDAMQDPFANQATEASQLQQQTVEAEQPQQQDQSVASPSKVLQSDSVWQSQPIEDYANAEYNPTEQTTATEQWQTQSVEDSIVEQPISAWQTVEQDITAEQATEQWQTQPVEDTFVEQVTEQQTQAENVPQSDNTPEAKKKPKTSTKRKTDNKE